MDISEIQPFIIPLVSAVLGYYGGYQSYKQKVKSENINAKRDRLLKFILKVEDYLSVLVESSFLIADISSKEELIDSLETNQKLYGKEFLHISDEIKNIKAKLKEELNPQAKEAYNNRLNSISLRLPEITQELKYIKHTYDLSIPEIKQMREKAENFMKRIIADDVGSTSHIIDPSGELGKCLLELQSICSDKTKHYYSDPRVIKLRGKVNKFFNKQIEKIG